MVAAAARGCPSYVNVAFWTTTSGVARAMSRSADALAPPAAPFPANVARMAPEKLPAFSPAIDTPGNVAIPASSVSDEPTATPFRLNAISAPGIGAPDSVSVAWIDGLAFVDGALIAHHPLSFWRIARYPLDAAMRRIEGRQLLEANTADGRTSSTGEVVGDEFVYIGNSQIDRMNSGTLDSAKMDPVSIYSVPLTLAAVGRVAVSLSRSDSVATFDAQSLDRITTLPVGKGPHEIAVSRDGARAYVADAGDRSIS